jgi:transmembrane sensor
MSHKEVTNHAHIAAQAAEWFTLMQDTEVSIRDRARFLEWLGESSRHVEEYLEVSALWRSLDRTQAMNLSAEELIAQACADETASNVVQLRVPRSASLVAQDEPASSRLALRAAAVVATLAVLVGGAVGADRWMYGARYATDIGEQRSVTLTDGSILRLNTQSSVRVRMRDNVRHVTLTSGEAMFQVAKDPARPFRVSAGETTVEALGTVFNVYRGKQETTVTVLEGRVRVSSAPTSQESVAAPAESPVRVVELAPRQRAHVSSQGIMPTENDVSPDEASAWTERRLVFNVEPLSQVVEEFNRYNELRLQVIDPELASMEISGNFHANDPQSLVQFLVHTESVSTKEEKGGVLQLYRK